jgi:hypothetical protein
MAVGATYGCKGGASLLAGRCSGSRGRWGQHPHKVGKPFDVRDYSRVRIAGGCGRSREVECVFGSGVEETARCFVALLREKLVRDSALPSDAQRALSRPDLANFYMRSGSYAFPVCRSPPMSRLSPAPATIRYRSTARHPISSGGQTPNLAAPRIGSIVSRVRVERGVSERGPRVS